MGRERARIYHRSFLRTGLSLALVLLGIIHAGAEPAWPPREFPITFWCGPPPPFITVEQYRRISQAGFNVVMPPCEGAATVERNHKILDTARATGLKVVLEDSRMPLAIQGKPEAEAAVKAIVSDYRRHPALLGYFVTDEPGADRFVGLAEVVALLHKLDPDHLVFINLLPNYATNNLTAPSSQLNTNTYDDYLDKFVRIVHPDLISWDHYHFLKNGDRSGFLSNLAAVQKAANAPETSLPYWQIVLSVEHGPYRPLTEDELRYEAMQSLVYGVQGLAYFTYWLPNDPSFTWNHAIMNRDGTPGPLYEAVKQVNREVGMLAVWLYGAKAIETYQSGTVPDEGRPQPADDTVKVTGPGNLSVGVFRGRGGSVLVMLANRDYHKPVTTKLSLDVGDHPVEQLDLKTNKWHPVKGLTDKAGILSIEIPLAVSGAALLRWY